MASERVTIRKRADNMWVGTCTYCNPTQEIPYWSFGATLGAMQEHLRRAHRPVPAEPVPCGGISTNFIPPAWCEVHMAPWGHKKNLPVWGKSK